MLAAKIHLPHLSLPQTLTFTNPTIKSSQKPSNFSTSCLKSSSQSVLTETLSTTLAKTRVKVLSEALPFIQKFRGKTVVVTYGGAAMKSEALLSYVIADLVLLSCIGLRIVFVHDGGPEINQFTLLLLTLKFDLRHKSPFDAAIRLKKAAESFGTVGYKIADYVPPEIRVHRKDMNF